jgi:hypothetical protein
VEELGTASSPAGLAEASAELDERDDESRSDFGSDMAGWHPITKRPAVIRRFVGEISTFGGFLAMQSDAQGARAGKTSLGLAQNQAERQLALH